MNKRHCHSLLSRGYIVPALVCGAGALIGGFAWAWNRFPVIKEWMIYIFIGGPMIGSFYIMMWLFRNGRFK